MSQLFDIAIIGGGINGCGIAADAAQRGLSVILIEKDDIASKTSSSSTKLIHGGLRYLEYFKFSLVKKSLNERQILLNLAPHLVFPIPFVLPFQKKLRPSWMLRAGLFLYDNLSRTNQLLNSKLIKRTLDSQYFNPLKPLFKKGFLFYDAATDDARLTLANALQAKAYGATIFTRTELLNSRIDDKIWNLETISSKGTKNTIKARSVINATGPWVELINQKLTISDHYKLSLIKGSHLVVDRLYEGDHAYLLQHEDKRIVFVIPYHGYTMIGTTDVAFLESPSVVSISPEEIDYLFKLISQYFNWELTTDNIKHSWSGIRPLLAGNPTTPQALTRDYTYHYTNQPAPAISIYGGKITTYRQLSEEAVNALRDVFPLLANSVTQKSPLPGSVFLKNRSYEQYCYHAREKYHWLDKSILERLLRTYGTLTESVLQNSVCLQDLGTHFGYGLFQREVDYLRKEEWAETCEDILWRRTKLGLFFKEDNYQQLTSYLQS